MNVHQTVMHVTPEIQKDIKYKSIRNTKIVHSLAHWFALVDMNVYDTRVYHVGALFYSNKLDCAEGADRPCAMCSVHCAVCSVECSVLCIALHCTSRQATDPQCHLVQCAVCDCI